MSIKKTAYENVFSVQYKGLVKGLRYAPKFLRKIFVKRAYERLQFLCGADFDVVWSFDNSVWYDFDALPPRVLKISHIVDLNQDFQTKIAASTADYCFCTTEVLRLRLLKYNSQVAKINHGFNLSGDRDSTVQVSNTPTALYAGNLSMPYIDWHLLHTVVTANPNVRFLFLGPNDTARRNRRVLAAKEKVMSSGNVFFIGRVEAKELLKYYVAADVLLVAYQEHYHQEQANPHKMMEYLGSGKLVIASFTSEFRHLADSGLILMSRRNTEFSLLFNTAIAQLNYWNCDSLQQARKAFAMENTYDRQIQRIERIITPP